MMRTQMVGTLRAEDVGRARSRSCGWVASRRDHGGVVFLDLRDASGIVQIVADPSTRRRGGAPGRARVGAADRGRGARPARGHGERGAAHRRGRGERGHARGAERGRAAAVPARRAGRRRRRGAAAPLPLPGPAPARRCSATCGSGRPSTRRCARRWPTRASSRSRRRCSSRRRPRARATSSSRRGCSPARSTRCRRARSSSSSC